MDLLSNFSIEKESIKVNRKNCEYFDMFWRLKQKIYSNYIYSDINLKREAFFTYLLKTLKEKGVTSIELLREFTDNQILANFEQINDEDWKILYQKFNSDDYFKNLIIIKIHSNTNQYLIEQNIKSISEKVKKKFPLFEIYDIRLIKNYYIHNSLDDYIKEEFIENFNQRYSIEKELKIIGQLNSVKNTQFILETDNKKLSGKRMTVPTVEYTKEIIDFIYGFE